MERSGASCGDDMVSDAGTRKNDALWINDDVTDKQAVRRSLFADRCSPIVVRRSSLVDCRSWLIVVLCRAAALKQEAGQGPTSRLPLSEVRDSRVHARVACRNP